MKACERLIRYAKVYTTSDGAAETKDNPPVPSSQNQFDLAHLLEAEMRELGLSDVRCDEHAYVYGFIPASAGCETAPSIGFIAHIDTAPDFPGENVNPQIHENYDGKRLEIGAGLALDPGMFAHLPKLSGKTLITTDGTTLLGADDKAGVAEIMTMAEKLLAENIPHGRVCIAFTPDEEIGHGAELLDIEAFGADFAYTVDGGRTNGIECENFNACYAALDINGVNIHPGSAKNKMINASLVAMEANAMLPADEIPACTEKYEGFYHLTDMSGDVAHSKLEYIVRDFDPDNFVKRQEYLREIEKKINDKYGEGSCELTIRQQYRNMAELVSRKPEVIELAKRAITAAGLTPVLVPIRGGTDGARLTYRGLICPNLGTGEHGCHGPYEHIAAEDMDTVVEIITNIIKIAAE